MGPDTSREAFEALFAGLSGDPYLGSYTLYTRLEDRLPEVGARTELEFSYACGVLEAYFEMVGLRAPSGFSDGGDGQGRFEATYYDFRNRIFVNYSRYVQQASLSAYRGAQADAVGFAALSANERTDIQAKLDRFRSLIEQTTLSTPARAALLQPLERLFIELNKSLTPTAPFFALAGELSFVGRRMGPARGEAEGALQSAISVLGNARLRREFPDTPAPANTAPSGVTPLKPRTRA